MMEFIETRIGKMLNEIKLAYLSGVNVVYIPTRDKELINEIVFGEECIGAVIPRMGSDEKICKDANEGRESENTENYNWNLPFNPDNRIWNKLSVPELFVYIGTNTSHKDYSSWISPCILDIKREKKRSVKDCVSEILDYIYNNKQTTNKYIDRDLRKRLSRSLIIVNTPDEEPIPADIEPYAKIVRVPPLSDEEIRELILEDLKKYGIVSNYELLDKIIAEMRGFSPRRIKTTTRRLIYKGIITDAQGKNAEPLLNEVIRCIRKEKEEELRNIAGLNWEEVNDSPGAVGMDNITEWLDGYVKVFDDILKAERNHIDIPKGILITGIPGSGKSLMAKTAAKKLGLPLISLDMGAMQSSLHGESEQNMIRALKKAEELSPAILWIDEIEKAFSGSSADAGEGDSGVAKRLFGKFLTWMQEKKAACFVFATANDITRLPPELFRSERFDRKFFSFLPTLEECAEMLASQVIQSNKKYAETLNKCMNEEKRGMAGKLFDERLEDVYIWKSIITDSCDTNLTRCHKAMYYYEWNRVYDDELKQYPFLSPFKIAYGCNNLDKGFVEPGKIKLKIFTGADIAAILKEIKRKIIDKYSDKYYTTDDVKFTEDDVREAARVVFTEHKSYGETNLKDVVSCFLNLHKNQFEPASKNSIISLEDYNEDKIRYEPSDRVHCNKDYNKIVYRKLVAAINYYALKFYREGKR